MNLKTVKNLTEAKLKGITVTWTKTDSSVRDITFTDEDGNCVVVNGQYGLSIFVPKPFEEADRYVLSGKFMGLVDVRKVFEYEHEAKGELEEFQTKAGYGVETGLKISKARVQVSDSGEVKFPDDIPF